MEDIVAAESNVVCLVLIAADSERLLWLNGGDRRVRIEGSPTGSR